MGRMHSRRDKSSNREALLARDDDKALATHTKGGRKKSYFQKETYKESQPPNKFNHKESHPRRFQKKGQRKERDYLSVQCYHCDKMGHIAKFCPARREEYKRKHKRHHAHAVEDEGRTLCTRFDKEPTLHFSFRKERLQSCLYRWRSSYVG
jgi:hypothetical protein